MTDWGLKVSKTGKDIASSDIRDLTLSSAYPMLKYHSDNYGEATLTTGATDTYVDFTHTLGYVPAFIAYQNFTGAWRYIPGIPTAIGYTAYAYAYADSTKVRCGYRLVTGSYNTYTYSVNDMFSDIAGVGTIRYSTGAGKVFTDTFDGAIRFGGVTIPQGTSITLATWYFYVDEIGSGGSNVNLNIYGIDEDNTADFSSNPMGRSQTTASTNYVSNPSENTYATITVTSAVQEIVNRGGWSSGNNMGFFIKNNSSPDGNHISDSMGAENDSYLSVQYGSSKTIGFRAIIFKDKIA